MCKSFPPPLVRGGVLEVGLETKYRDIADGNVRTLSVREACLLLLETKYRDIADRNQPLKVHHPLSGIDVGNQVPRYSGWKYRLVGGTTCLVNIWVYASSVRITMPPKYKIISPAISWPACTFLKLEACKEITSNASRR